MHPIFLKSEITKKEEKKKKTHKKIYFERKGPNLRSR